MNQPISSSNLPRNRYGRFRRGLSNYLVLSGAGFWVSRDPQAEVLIHRASVSGVKREINLCQQLKNPPSELFPITLAGAWEDVQTARKSGKLPVQRSPWLWRRRWRRRCRVWLFAEVIGAY